MLQDRERAASREALMRSPTTPRRGRVHEGLGPHTEALTPQTDTLGLQTDTLSPYNSPQPTREASAEPLMRLSSHPPATPPARSAELATGSDAAGGLANGGVDMEDVYEEMIVRLRRELLSERERMGAPLGT